MLKVQLTLQLTGIDSTFNDSNNMCKLFVGFKSSNQILDQLQILCRDLNIGFQQNECYREGCTIILQSVRLQSVEHTLMFKRKSDTPVKSA